MKSQLDARSLRVTRSVMKQSHVVSGVLFCKAATQQHMDELSCLLLSCGGWEDWVLGSRFQVSGSRFKVSGFRFQVQGSRCKVQGAGCRVQGAGCWVLVPAK